MEAAKLDAYWSRMRLAKSDVLGLTLVKQPPLSGNSVADSSSNTSPEVSNDGPTLLDAVRVYLNQKGKGRPKIIPFGCGKSL